MKELRFTIQLSEDDYYNYLLHATFKAVHSMSFPKRLGNTLAWSMMLGIPLFLLIWAFDGVTTGLIFLGLYASISIMGLLRGNRVSPLARGVLKKKAKRFAQSPANREYFRSTNYRITKEGIQTSRDGDITVTKWNSIVYMDETSQQVLLCTNDNRVFILPVDQIPAYEDCLNLIKQHLAHHLGTEVVSPS